MPEKQKGHANISKNVQPSIVALFHIAIAFLLGFFVSLPYKVPVLLRNVGFVLTIIGFLFGVGALIEFRKARTTLDPYGSVKQIVVVSL